MTEDRVFGSLLGQLVGDAVGWPVARAGNPNGADWPTEAMSYYEWLSSCLIVDEEESASKQGFALPEVVGKINNLRCVGQITDDSQLSLALARTLAETDLHRSPLLLDIERFCERLVRLHTHKSIIGIGWTVDAAVRSLTDKGVKSWESSGGTSSSNGASMRAGPIGLSVCCIREPSRLRSLAILQSRPTHSGEEAQEAAVVFAHAVSWLTNQQRVLPGNMLSFLEELRKVNSSKRIDGAIELASKFMGSSCPSEWATVLKEFYAIDPRHEWDGEGISGDAAASLGWILWAFTSTVHQHCHRVSDDDAIIPNQETKKRVVIGPQQLFMAVMKAALFGAGDTDTKCSMAGALVGALFGSSAIPSRLVASLCDETFEGTRDTAAEPFGIAEVRTLATKLHSLRCDADVTK